MYLGVGRDGTVSDADIGAKTHAGIRNMAPWSERLQGVTGSCCTDEKSGINSPLVSKEQLGSRVATAEHTGEDGRKRHWILIGQERAKAQVVYLFGGPYSLFSQQI